MSSWTKSLFKGNNTNANNDRPVEFNTEFKGQDGDYSPSPDRAEEGGRSKRKLGRIDRPRTHSIVGSIGDSDDSGEDMIKQQMIAEEGNAIKYRWVVLIDDFD